MHACRCRSGEQQAVDLRCDQCFSGLATTLNHGKHAARKVSFTPDLGHGRPNQRGQLGRLEHHRIPGKQRWNDMPVRKMAREIIGTKHRHHPVRLMAQDHFAEGRGGPPLAGALCPRRYRKLDLADHGTDFLPRLPQRLAGFARNHCRQPLHVILERGAKGSRSGDARAQRLRPPRSEGLASSPHRLRDVCCRCGRPRPQYVPGDRARGNQLLHQTVSHN